MKSPGPYILTAILLLTGAISLAQVPIDDIQQYNLAGAPATPYLGQTVTVVGDIYVLGGTYNATTWYLQDATGGICFFKSGAPALTYGDRVEITGQVSTYAGEIQIYDPTITLLPGGAEVVPTAVPLPDLMSPPDYERAGSLVSVSGTVSGKGASGFYLYQGTDMVQVTIDFDTGINLANVANGDLYEVTGPCTVYNGELGLKPRRQSDLVEGGSGDDPPLVLSYDSDNWAPREADGWTLTFMVAEDGALTGASLQFRLMDVSSEWVTVPGAIGEEVAGIYQVSFSGAPSGTSSRIEWRGDLEDDFGHVTPLPGGEFASGTWLVSDFQTVSPDLPDQSSPMLGQAVNVEGVLVAGGAETGDPETMVLVDAALIPLEGVPVSFSGTSVGNPGSVAWYLPGDKLRIGGIVTELDGLTKLVPHTASAIILLSYGNNLPEPARVHTAILIDDSLVDGDGCRGEAYESCWVRPWPSEVVFTEDFLTSGTYKVSSTGQLIDALTVAPSFTPAYIPELGDVLDIAGYMTYRGGEFQIVPTADDYVIPSGLTGVPWLPNCSARRQYLDSEPASVLVSPGGNGTPLSSCYAHSIAGTDATIEVTVLDAMNEPIADYPKENISLITSLGGLKFCAQGLEADTNTGAQGKTMISGAVSGGGHTDPSAGELTHVTINGTPLPGPGLDIQFNSVDYDGDTSIDMWDLLHITTDNRRNPTYAVDFNGDGLPGNLPDGVLWASFGCEGCVPPAGASPDPEASMSLSFYEDRPVHFCSWSALSVEGYVYLYLHTVAVDSIDGFACTVHAKTESDFDFPTGSYCPNCAPIPAGGPGLGFTYVQLANLFPSGSAGPTTPLAILTYLWEPSAGGLEFTIGPLEMDLYPCWDFEDPIYVTRAHRILTVPNYPKNGRVTYTRAWVNPEQPIVDGIYDVENDQGLMVRIGCYRSGYDAPDAPYTITNYEIYRQLETGKAAASPTGAGHIRLVGAKVDEVDGWTLVSTVPADGADMKTFFVPTERDSGSSGSDWRTTFFVRACTPDSGVYFDSDPISGYSIDNLVPATPVGITTAFHSDHNDLAWDENPEYDVVHYNVYRGLDPEAVPGAEDLVAQVCGTSWTDDVSGGAHDGWDYVYWVSAVDDAGQESELTDWAGTIVTGIGDQAVPKEYALHESIPNPFNALVTLRFDLPVGGRVRLEVYDVAGRRVRTLLATDLPAGRHETAWNGKDERGARMASGNYIARIEAGSFRETRRMTLLK